MAKEKLSPFESELAKHAKLGAKQQVGKRAVFNSLDRVVATGKETISTQNDGATLAFAKGALSAYQSARELNVKPPYTDTEIANLNTEIAGYAKLVEISEGIAEKTALETPTQPTNTATIPTAGVKS